MEVQLSFRGKNLFLSVECVELSVYNGRMAGDNFGFSIDADVGNLLFSVRFIGAGTIYVK